MHVTSTWLLQPACFPFPLPYTSRLLQTSPSFHCSDLLFESGKGTPAPLLLSAPPTGSHGSYDSLKCLWLPSLPDSHEAATYLQQTSIPPIEWPSSVGSLSPHKKEGQFDRPCSQWCTFSMFISGSWEGGGWAALKPPTRS